MNIPLSVYSDGSLEWGNDTPAELAKNAKENGYTRLVLIDNDSTSHLVSFLKATKNNDISPIVGLTLTVQCPTRAHVAFLESNKAPIDSFKERFNLASTPNLFEAAKLKEAEKLLKVFNSSFTEPTNKKLAAALPKVEEYLTQDELNEIKALNTKDNQVNAFEMTLQKVSKLLIPQEVKSVGDFDWFRTFLSRLKYDQKESKLIVVAKNFTGYKEILQLASLKAIKKRECIKKEIKGSLGVTLEDLEGYKKDDGSSNICVVDPLTNYSLLGGVSEKTEIYSKWGSVIDVFGVGVHSGSLDFVASSKKPSIPFPIAHYAKEESYESYCVKVAAHTDCEIRSLFFVPPKKDTYIKKYADIVEYYSSIDIDGFDPLFWDKHISTTNVPLGEVHLPVYDMPVKEVIEHAYRTFKNDERVFGSEDEAVADFEEWIKEDMPEGAVFASYKQKKLNDYCLHKLTMDGLEPRLEVEYGDEAESHRDEYLKRIEYEYGVIESMGFSGYFLIEYDFVSYARSVGVPVGPGRGSAAGSLIVYCMEITDVDPIVHDLQFERFLNPERVSMPDIDVDFGDGGVANRETVLEYIRDKHQTPGTPFPSSSQIANIMRYQLKSAISIVRKVYGLSMVYENYLKEVIKAAEAQLGIAAPKSIEWDQFLSLDMITKKMKKEATFRKVILKAKDLSGKMSSFGVHAGGVVISPTTVTDFSSVSCDDNGNFFSQKDKDDVEAVGLIKFDVLGARTLSIIAECVNNIKKSKGVDIDVRRIDMHDPTVYELICQQNLCDVFQLESPGMKKLVGNLRPQNIGELAVLSALFRPGALQSGMVEEYIDVKHGKKPPTYDHPAIEKTTKDTFGCIVYQEQVMSIVRELAGYSLGQADLLRRAMGKKKVEEMAKQRSIYTQRAMAFWREHYLEVGEKQGLAFKLDVNLSDLKDELCSLGIYDFFDDLGYLSEMDSVVGLLKKLTNLSDNDVENLKARLSNCDYKTMFFKEHYQSSIYNAVKGNVDGERLEEVKIRVFYALSQYVRFNQIFNKVEKFAGYGFNKSHAIAYSVVTYVCAYLKRHYPTEFYSAALSFREISKLNDTVSEASQRMGVRVLGPEINKSLSHFSYEEDSRVRYGLDKLKNIGHSANPIVTERERGGPFVDVYDFVLRMSDYKNQPDVKGFYSLATSGAFDSVIPKRIQVEKKRNGRQYIAWLRNGLVDGEWTKDGRDAVIHREFDEMTDFEFDCYVLSLIPTKNIKKIKLESYISTTDINQTKLDVLLKKGDGQAKSKIVELLVEKRESNSIDEEEFEFLMSSLNKAGPITDSSLLARIASLSDDFDSVDETVRSEMAKVFMKKLVKASMSEKEFGEVMTVLNESESVAEHSILVKTVLLDNGLKSFHARFLKNASIFLDKKEMLANIVSDFLDEELKKEPTETLNEERELAGFYITSNPLKVLKVAERVEMEPPSSVIDGCPVPISKIDSNYDRRKVTTYGIVRDIQINTVKKKDSQNYGTRMFKFKIEDGAEGINCIIFGNKNTDEASKLITDGCVALFAGKVKLNNFGLGLEVEVIRRYFPIVDERVLVKFRK